MKKKLSNLAQVKAKKSLGQHFLFDEHLCQEIVASSALISNKVVVEVGPGHGSLTDAILSKNPKQLFLIEKDAELISSLHRKYQHHSHVKIIEQDALKCNLASLTDQPIIIIANLPYNAGTQMLCNWLVHNCKQLDHLTLMFQKEVIDRICAVPGCKDYGRLSVLCQSLAQCSKSFDVEARHFTPPPKVTSAIVQIQPIQPTLPVELVQALEKVTASAFSCRRKILKTNLKNLFSAQELIALGALPTQRAEELNIDTFLRLANALTQKTT
mgnify:CR=1 FL=1